MDVSDHDHSSVGGCNFVILSGVLMFTLIHHLPLSRSAFLSYTLTVLLALVVFQGISHGQTVTTTTSVTDGRTPSGLQPGGPAGAYPLSDFENVNLYNGNLNFRLPLLHVGGRGSAQMTIMLALNLKSWHIKHIHKQMPDESTIDSYVPTHIGWRPYSGYGAGDLSGRNYGLQTANNLSCRWYSKTLSRLTFSASDGTEYELRDQLTNGQPLDSTCTQGAYRGTVFITADGSAATFVSDTAIYDNPAVNAFGAHGFSVSGYLMLRDGTRYRIDNSNVSWIRDRNGNKISFSYSSSGMTITDQLNRTVTVNYDVSDVAPYGLCDQIIYRGFGGAQRILRVSKTNLANLLRPNSGYTIKTLGGAAGLFPETNGSSSTTHDPVLTSAVWLPDGRSYRFYYNSYGEMARVELPTGGAYEYDMTAGSGVICPEFCWPEDDRQIYRRVAERRVYANGGSGSSYDRREIYTSSEALGSTASTVTCETLGPTGSVLSRTRHYFDGSALDSLFGGDVVYAYAAWYEGNEKQTDVLDTAGDIASATVLRRSITTRVQRAAISWWAAHAAAFGLDPGKEPPNDPRVTQITSTVEPAAANLVSKQTFGYDDTVPFNNRNNLKEYGFGNGSPGALIRETRTTFLTSPTYTDPNVHLRNLPVRVSVYDSSGTERARSTVDYDNYVADTYHAGLVSRANISGFDPAFTTSYTTRGNATGSTVYLLVNGVETSSITNYSQYDVAGNVVKLIDPRSTPGNVIATTIEYDDRYGTPAAEARSNSVPTELTGLSSFALPTKVTNALGHTIYSKFDYYLGQPVNGEDPNGVVAAGYFNDLLDRPTQIRRAVGTTLENQTTFAYDDSNRTVTTASDRDTNNDGLLVHKLLYDAVGRTIETRQYEGGTNYCATQTQYDALGRAYKTSDPFCPWRGETAVWTTQGFDVLGRTTSVTTADGAVVSTSYSGNSTTVTDQAGRARKSVTDALGRLISVYEDPNGVNYVTTYEYDVLDDLTKVVQDNDPNNPQQPPRVFAYDSLKRLTSASNPESGTVTYQYDNNSNLTIKTDARGVVTQNLYDALNRVTNTLYRINGQPDPNTGDLQYIYDNATYGKGRLWLTYKWDAKPSHTAVGYYDALGRVKQFYNLFGDGQGGWSTGYEVYRDYDLAGDVRLQRYPSGRTVSYTYDTAGRTSSFSGDLGDGVNRSYASSFNYNARNQITQELFGTQTPLYHKLQYNMRGQLWDVRVSTGADINGSWNRGCLQFFYDGSLGYGTSGPDNNGNLLFANFYIPLDEQYNGWAIHRQRYNYDSLNRIASVAEYFVSDSQAESQQSQQTFFYDRYGNRTIVAPTWGAGINNRPFSVNVSNNRLGVPAGQTGTMIYDNAGNLTTDTYTGAGDRVYDAENRIIQAWGGAQNNQWQYYTYNAAGQRVRRKVDNTETWEIYGIDSELVAEYPANGVAGNPQKEYGYRNGQLLVTAEPGPKIQWLVPDHLGTPRIILDQTGSLANVKRHDYLPFGEELFAPAGGRNAAQGYESGDGVRQQFTSKERDVETGLDYFEARYYSSSQGRFTSPDLLSGRQGSPQSWNRYAYSINNPLKYIDPSGLWWYTKDGGDGHPEWFDDDPGEGYTRFTQYAYYGGAANGYVALDPFSNNFLTGFGSLEDATAFSDAMAGQTMLERDPPQDISQLDGTLEVAGYIGGATAAVRIGGLALRGAAAAITARRAAAGAAEEVVGLFGKVSVDALEAAASSSGPTVQIVTKLTQFPQAGRALSVATGEGAEALANAARSTGQLYRANVPQALLGQLERSGLAIRSTTQMAGSNATAIEYRFLPQATRFITSFFKE